MNRLLRLPYGAIWVIVIAGAVLMVAALLIFAMNRDACAAPGSGTGSFRPPPVRVSPPPRVYTPPRAPSVAPRIPRPSSRPPAVKSPQGAPRPVIIPPVVVEREVDRDNEVRVVREARC